MSGVGPKLGVGPCLGVDNKMEVDPKMVVPDLGELWDTHSRLDRPLLEELPCYFELCWFVLTFDKPRQVQQVPKAQPIHPHPHSSRWDRFLNVLMKSNSIRRNALLTPLRNPDAADHQDSFDTLGMFLEIRESTLPRTGNRDMTYMCGIGMGIELLTELRFELLIEISIETWFELATGSRIEMSIRSRSESWNNLLIEL